LPGKADSAIESGMALACRLTNPTPTPDRLD
jgi:hypothetical protein